MNFVFQVHLSVETSFTIFVVGNPSSFFFFTKVVYFLTFLLFVPIVFGFLVNLYSSKKISAQKKGRGEITVELTRTNPGASLYLHGNKNSEEPVDAIINAKLDMVIVMLTKQTMSWESLVAIE